MKKTALLIFISITLAIGAYGYQQFIGQENFVSTQPESVNEAITIERLAVNLEVPWELAFLPNGEILLTQRGGQLVHLSADGQKRQELTIAGVSQVGEGGLLGLALDPNFTHNHWLYLYLTTTVNGELINQVERYTWRDAALHDRQVILQGIKGAANHNGGRIAFGPDDLLYVATGDAQVPALAQDKNSLSGKILRLHADGNTPADNPFGNLVYSYGHRNVQGLTWDSAGRLWATEHGRSGLASGFDELNLITAGQNYGWPIIQGDETAPDMTAPVIHSGAQETWAPAAAEHVDGSIFFGGLRGAALYQAKINSDSIDTLLQHLQDVYGRLRVVKLGPDGYLYLGTSNRDGRGRVRESDDQLIRVQLQWLNK